MYINNKTTPILSYDDSFENKLLIYKQNKGKSGIYRWNNKITNKSYIGSSRSLNRRFNFYFCYISLLNLLKKKFKYNMSCFIEI